MSDSESRAPLADHERRRAERAALRTEQLRVRELPEWRRIASAIRRQIAASVELDASPERLALLAAEAERVAGELEQSATGKRKALVDSAWESEERGMAYLPFSPIMGALNPASIGLDIRRETDRVVAEVRLAEPVEGGTGLVHGGVIAGIYDELLAAANLMIKSGGPTGTLTVLYRRPTPLYAPLRFEGWVEKTDAKKVYAKGHCLLAGDVLSEAEAIFVKFTPARQLSVGWQPPGMGQASEP